MISKKKIKNYELSTQDNAITAEKKQLQSDENIMLWAQARIEIPLATVAKLPIFFPATFETHLPILYRFSVFASLLIDILFRFC